MRTSRASARSCTTAIVRLARDARLLDGAAARRDALVERCADEAHAGVTARWLPWNDDGSDPIDWVGIDIAGRPVVGAIRATLGIADVPALVAGWHLLDLEREIWTPGAVGFPRIFISADEIASEAREILESLAGPIGAGTVPAAAGARARRARRSATTRIATRRGGLERRREARSERRGRSSPRTAPPARWRTRVRRSGAARRATRRPRRGAQTHAAQARRAAELERGRFAAESERSAADDEIARRAARAVTSSPQRSRRERGRRAARTRRAARAVGAAAGAAAVGARSARRRERRRSEARRRVRRGELGSASRRRRRRPRSREFEVGDAELGARRSDGELRRPRRGEDEQLSSELEATLAESEEETERRARPRSPSKSRRRARAASAPRSWCATIPTRSWPGSCWRATDARSCRSASRRRKA